ncbi:MAG: hypothetical protein HY778_13130 [Betaproteobacteria bacterium]|nr:hypothetical protein [Betaproteobacteria bacterium]
MALLLLAAVLAPFTPQDPTYHRFADARSWLGVPNAADGLSNLAFILAGAWGLVRWRRGRMAVWPAPMNAFAGVFFAGLVLTGLGSFWYHLAPDDARLAWDRYVMVVPLPGVLGMAAAQKVSPRAGTALGAAALVLGPLSVAWWRWTGNVAPYGVVQFGGMGLVVWMLFLRGGRAGPNWAALVGAYALAKVFELQDEEVFRLSGGLVSGHTLKHLAAACAALAVRGKR